MAHFSVYGNCQSTALANTLTKNEKFNALYEYKVLKPVQTLFSKEVFLAENIFSNSDLLIHQIIADTYRIPTLSTSQLMQQRKKGSKSFTFPSLYFNAYFPHLDIFQDKKSILNFVHDYIIMYSYVKGLTHRQILDLIQNESLYPKDISLNLLNNSLITLQEREADLDITISGFIEDNYKNIKLFNQFNHPKGIIFDHIANQIFDLLTIEKIQESTLSHTTLESAVITPIYKSTYKNLELTFEEDFATYSTMKGLIKQDEVVSEFLKSYKNFNKEHMLEAIKRKKPFIIEIFKKLGI